MKHNVKHGDQAEGCYGTAEKIQIAVMFRTDVFRYARARKMNSRPGPRELYDIVNTETARHKPSGLCTSPTSTKSLRKLKEPKIQFE